MNTFSPSNFKTGINVIDQIIAGSWDMVEKHVERAEQHQKEAIEENNRMYNKGVRGYRLHPPFKKWGNHDKTLSALHFIGKFTQSMMKVLEESDKLVRAKMTTELGKIVGDIVIKRKGKEYHIETQAIGAGGYNIQQYHYRYLVKSDLPKKQAPKSFDKLDAEEKRVRLISGAKRRIEYLDKLIAERKESEYFNPESVSEEALDKIAKELDKHIRKQLADDDITWIYKTNAKGERLLAEEEWNPTGENKITYFRDEEKYIAHRVKKNRLYHKRRHKEVNKDVADYTKEKAKAEKKITDLESITQIRPAIEGLEKMASISEGEQKGLYRAEITKFKRRLTKLEKDYKLNESDYN